jgi:hypothetical protein
LALNISVVWLNLVQTIPRSHEHRRRNSQFKQEKRLIVIALADVLRPAVRRAAAPLASRVFPDGMAHFSIQAESASIHRLSGGAAWAEGPALLTLRLDEAP